MCLCIQLNFHQWSISMFSIRKYCINPKNFIQIPSTFQRVFYFYSWNSSDRKGYEKTCIIYYCQGVIQANLCSPIKIDPLPVPRHSEQTTSICTEWNKHSNFISSIWRWSHNEHHISNIQRLIFVVIQRLMLLICIRMLQNQTHLSESA